MKKFSQLIAVNLLLFSFVIDLTLKVMRGGIKCSQIKKCNFLFASVLKLGIVSALAVLCEGYGQFKSERELKQDCIGQFVFLNYAIKFAGPGE